MNWIDETVSRLGFRDKGRPAPSMTLLDRLAVVAGGALPDEFRHYVARYGAGFVGDGEERVAAPVSEPSPWGEQVTFSTTHALHGDELITTQETYKGRIPDGVIAFACDAGGNELCLDVAGAFPGSVWFWDHEQRWFREFFSGSFEDAAREVAAAAPDVDVRRLSVHDIIRGWARLHADRFDRPADYMGMYRMAPTFADFLRALQRVPS